MKIAPPDRLPDHRTQTGGLDPGGAPAPAPPLAGGRRGRCRGACWRVTCPAPPHEFPFSHADPAYGVQGKINAKNANWGGNHPRQEAVSAQDVHRAL